MPDRADVEAAKAAAKSKAAKKNAARKAKKATEDAAADISTGMAAVRHASVSLSHSRPSAGICLPRQPK